MRKGAAVLGFLVVLSPSVLRAQGVAIDHVKVGCIVAGKYPNLKACFAPVSSLARARVYFRVADAPPDWYYVEMASSDPCHAGVLPRPKKELVGRRIQYYVDAFDRAFAESRTPEAEALVVSSASECERRLPVAPFLNNATVTVFPNLPAGFASAAGGLGGAATAAIVVGGAAIVGGGVALATGGSEGSTGSTPTTTTPPPETLPTTTTTTTTTLPEVPFNPVFKVFKGATLVEGDSVVGTDPLQLRFDMCETTGPLRLRFGVEVDGDQKTDRCNSTITFRISDATPPFAGSRVRQSMATRTYAVRMTIRSEGPNNDPKANRRLTVQVVSSGEGGCTGDTQGPIVTLTKPPSGSVYPSPNPYPVHFEASASDSTTGNNGVARVEYKIGSPEALTLVPGTAAAAPWPVDWTEKEVNTYLGATCSKVLEVRAYAVDNCGNGTYSSPITITVKNTGSCSTPAAGAASGASSTSATLVSELGVPGGAGQVVANGEAVFPRAGRSPFTVRLKAGENRVEATLVEARSGGTWRFELGGLPGFQPDTLRAVAGDVVQLAADSVTFRLQGRAGERVVFAFRTER